jgi:ribosome-binding protein aMBF1 (putative translation factor)
MPVPDSKQRNEPPDILGAVPEQREYGAAIVMSARYLQIARDAQRRLGLTDAQLAERSATSKSHVSRFLHNKTTDVQAARIARALGIPAPSPEPDDEEFGS